MTDRTRTLLARLAGGAGAALAVAAGVLLHTAFSQTFGPGLVLALAVCLLVAVGLIVFAATRERADATRCQRDLLAALERDAIERKRAEIELRTSEERLRIVGDNLPGGAIYQLIVASDLDIRFGYVSAGIEPLLGLTPSELLADAEVVYRLIHPDDLPIVRAAQLASHRDLSPFDVEFRSYTARGELKWMHCRSMPRRLPDGRTERNGVILDATTRKNAEESLRQSEERFRRIVDTTPECVKRIAPDGALLDMNAAGLAMIEAASLEQVLGHSVFDLIPGEHRAAYAEFHERICRGDKGTIEFEMVGLKGTRRRVETHAVPWSHGPGVFAQLAVTRDITARKAAEEALRTSEELFRGIIANTSAGITLTDATGRFISCNPAFAALVGRSVEEVLQLTAEDLTHPDDWASQHSLFAEARAGRRERYAYTKRYLRPDGSAIWTELSFAAIHGPHGEYQYGLGVTIDVTAQRRLEEQLHEARKLEAIGRLAGGVAHDFNNLLTAVLGNLSLVRAAATDPNRPLLANIEQAASRAADLTRKLLGYARRSQLVPTPTEPSRAFDEAIDLVRRNLDPRIRVAVGVASNCGPVLADPVLLNRVLLDLCHNARDAMPNGGTLTLAAGPVEIAPDDPSFGLETQPGSFVRLSVADTGCGMDDAVKARLFEPFFTTKETGRGTGLGLAMVQGIVKQHGGWVECATAAGGGTRFDLYLPAAVDSVPTEARLVHLGHRADIRLVATPPGRSTSCEGSRTPPPERPAKTILLVDDESMIRTLGRVTLERAGYRVLLAEDGVDAVEVFARERSRIELVVLDVTMPRMSGRDAFRHIVRLAPKTRVLFSTGFSAEAVAEMHGAVGLLSKPYRPQDLIAAVRDALATDALGAVLKITNLSGLD